ncbi:SdrD B-like domain-containing protein [Amaricoccus sp. W119]|uniref:SdrD B-like domain-containing protein n=1 Tax=Amaricoccus sp. W119 TaxID=3391833 RepID=UPI0039A4C5DC
MLSARHSWHPPKAQKPTSGRTTFQGADHIFSGLPAGNYRVKFTAPDGTEFTTRSTVGAEAVNNDSDPNAETGITGVIKLDESERQKNVDAGLVETDGGDASIGDTVWYDTNGDGLLSDGETGAAGVTVELLDSDGDVVATTTTNAAGGYVFEDLDAGDYGVRFIAPDGYEFTTASPDAADAENNDSDADTTTGETGTITLGIGETTRNVDAGLVATDGGTASLGGTVWSDTSGEGTRDGAETGVAGVTVELLDAGGAVLATTTTDAAGDYAFENLSAGDYSVRFTAPDGTQFTTPSGVGAADADDDSDADTTTGETGTITLGIGETTRNVDAGLVATDGGTASLGGTVWSDTSGEGTRDGAETGVAGVTVELLDAGGAILATTTTDAAGDYAFENLSAGDYSVRFTAPDGTQFTTPSMVGAADADDDSDADTTTGETGTITLGIGETTRNVDAGLVATDSGTASIGDTVWFDTDGDGTRDGDEVGAVGVTVDLLGAGGAVVGTVVTDAAGTYLFDSLTAGDYRVRFTAPDGTAFTTSSGSGPVVADNDSDADELSGETGTISLSAGEAQTNVDAGLVLLDQGTASIGDTVWLDDNGTGTFDPGESGMSGITVDLLDSAGNVLATTQTDSNGRYLFEDLTAGDYRVRFDISAWAGVYTFTSPHGGAPDANNNDSDADYSGETSLFTLSAGEAELDIDAGLQWLPWDSPPWAEPDAGEICTDMVGTIDVLVNDTDAEGPVSVVSVDGQAISEGQTITASDGVLITLNGGVLSFDPTNSDYADLLVGEHEEAIYSYTIQDTVGNMASSTVTVEYCGARNTLETIGASLPESGAIVATRDMTSDGDFYNATVSETGDARFDGLEFEAVYCLEAPDPINFDVRVPVTLHLAEQGSVPAGSVANPQNLDMVNWILNQDFDSMDNGDGTGETYTEREIQGAIWGLTDNIVFVNETVNDGTTANAQEIYDLALANGQGFTPGEGDIVGIAAVPTAEAEAVGNEQTTIIGIRYENLEQDCDCLILA